MITSLVFASLLQWYVSQWIISVGSLQVFDHGSIGILAYNACMAQNPNASIVCTGKAVEAMHADADNRVTSVLHTLCDQQSALCTDLFTEQGLQWSPTVTPFGPEPTPPASVPVTPPGMPCVITLPFGGVTRTC